MTILRSRAAALVPCWLGLVLMAGDATGQLSSDAYEEAPGYRAADILSAEVRQSGHYRVRDQVALKGDMYVFDIDSDYGLYRVESLPMLMTRTHELRTLAQAISQYKVDDDAFAEQLRGQLTYNARTLVDVVVAPFSMAGQLASNIGQTARELTELGTTRYPAEDKTVYVDALSHDVIAGTHKRNVAFQLNLDPYSTNPKVQEFLNTVARARSGGHFKAGVVTVRVPPSRLVEVADGELDAGVRQALKQLSPNELDEGIDEQLQSLGVDEQARNAFLSHAHYSPRHKTAITAYLDYLGGVDNRAVLIEAALVARGEADALSFEMLARMLAAYHERVAPIAELRLLADLPIAITASGAGVVFMPVDRVFWDRRSDQIFDALGQRLSRAGLEGSELVLAGMLTDKARAGLTGHQFHYREGFLFALDDG